MAHTIYKLNNIKLSIEISDFGKCNADELQCSAHECVPLAWVCDGVRDCKNNVDEKNCSK